MYLGSLAYSSCNEDGETELAALELSNESIVLCISGSGARPLELLRDQPKKIYSVDMNPAQNALLELKLAGIKVLNYKQYLELLGLKSSTNRLALYQVIRQELPQYAQEYWDSHQKMLSLGVIYQGKWEKHFSLLAKVLRIFRPKMLKALLSFDSIEEQADFWTTSWNNRVWQNFLRVSTSRFVMKYLYKDPGFYEFVPTHFSVYHYLEHSLNQAANSILFKSSPFAQLLFTGRWPKDCLPKHLQEDAFCQQKQHSDCIEPITDSLYSFLQTRPSNSIDAFSLSDFSSYTNECDYTQTWKQIERCAKAHARVCERQFLVKRTPKNNRQLKPLDKLKRELEHKDNSIFYSLNLYQC